MTDNLSYTYNKMIKSKYVFKSILLFINFLKINIYYIIITYIILNNLNLFLYLFYFFLKI